MPICALVKERLQPIEMAISLNTTQALLVKLIRDEVPGRGDVGGGVKYCFNGFPCFPNFPEHDLGQIPATLRRQPYFKTKLSEGFVPKFGPRPQPQWPNGPGPKNLDSSCPFHQNPTRRPGGPGPGGSVGAGMGQIGPRAAPGPGPGPRASGPGLGPASPVQTWPESDVFLRMLRFGAKPLLRFRVLETRDFCGPHVFEYGITV